MRVSRCHEVLVVLLRVLFRTEVRYDSSDGRVRSSSLDSALRCSINGSKWACKLKAIHHLAMRRQAACEKT